LNDGYGHSNMTIAAIPLEDTLMIEDAGHRARPTFPTTIGAGEFKARCLRLMDEVAERHTEIVITKHGRPVARLVPMDEEVPDSFGAFRGTVRKSGADLVSPDPGAWGES
jgi:prevent-host-death family protein